MALASFGEVAESQIMLIHPMLHRYKDAGGKATLSLILSLPLPQSQLLYADSRDDRFFHSPLVPDLTSDN